MKQVVIRQFGGPEVLKIEEAPKPEPKGDQILVEVKAAGVNFADLKRRSDTYLEKANLPLVIGAEVAGIVTECGPNVTKFKKGDRVFGITGIGHHATSASISCCSG